MKTFSFPAALLGAMATLIAGLAHAHVSLEQTSAVAGTYQKLTFRVGHGCQGSATHTIAVSLPEGVTSAKPMPKSGWTIATPSARDVVWKGGPLPDGWFDEFSLLVKLPDTAGKYYFKVAQVCEAGRMDWTEMPGATAVTTPAPVLDVLPATGPAKHH
jgi:uncharacterized protein YcnI